MKLLNNLDQINKLKRERIACEIWNRHFPESLSIDLSKQQNYLLKLQKNKLKVSKFVYNYRNTVLVYIFIWGYILSLHCTLLLLLKFHLLLHFITFMTILHLSVKQVVRANTDLMPSQALFVCVCVRMCISAYERGKRIFKSSVKNFNKCSEQTRNETCTLELQ